MSVNVLYRTSARATGSAAPADPASTRSNCSRPAMPPVFLALSSSWL